MDREIKAILILGIIALLFLIVGIIMFIGQYDSSNNACKQLGYIKEDYNAGFNFCIDSEDNYHYIHLDCDWSGFNCNAKLIKVGEVSTLP